MSSMKLTYETPEETALITMKRAASRVVYAKKQFQALGFHFHGKLYHSFLNTNCFRVTGSEPASMILPSSIILAESFLADSIASGSSSISSFA